MPFKKRTTGMMTLMEHLESFNREERFFLISGAFGSQGFIN